MAFDRMRGVDDRFEPAVGGPEIPFLQEAGRCFGRGLIIEFLKGQPDLVGPRGLEMTRWEVIRSVS
ncbi:MAG TPA: hypothetical protein VJX94_11160 [Stellaceae bacterium]|nr:hypothetical protein [Stellaceae bacterium]